MVSWIEISNCQFLSPSTSHSSLSAPRPLTSSFLLIHLPHIFTFLTFHLKPPPLFLHTGTHVLVDETSLSPGQLSETGVKNLTALGNVTQWQKVHYDFHYHTSEFSCNLVSTSHTAANLHVA